MDVVDDMDEVDNHAQGECCSLLKSLWPSYLLFVSQYQLPDLR